jgi:hypothetical protein
VGDFLALVVKEIGADVLRVLQIVQVFASALRTAGFVGRERFAHGSGAKGLPRGAMRAEGQGNEDGQNHEEGLRHPERQENSQKQTFHCCAFPSEAKNETGI